MVKPVTIVFASSVWLVAASGLHPQAPQFTARVDRVLADFIVSTKDGAPVVDVPASAIELKVDGRPRTIDSVSLIRFDLGGDPNTASPPGQRSDAGKADAAARSAAPTFDRDGRQIVLVFDQASIRPDDERQAVEGAERFVDNLDDFDRVAVVLFPDGPHVDLTRDRRAIHTALADVQGFLPPPPRETPVDQVHRACSDYDRSRDTLTRMRDLLRGLAALDGFKTVVVVSGGLLPAGSETSGSHSAPCATTTVGSYLYRDLEAAASAARAQYFLIQPHYFLIAAGDAPRGEPQFLGYPDYHAYLDGQLDGLQDVAGVTGGELFRLSGSADAVFKQIRRETSAYYVLAFAPTAADADGKPHKIEIRVARKGVTVRARRSFTLPHK